MIVGHDSNLKIGSVRTRFAETSKYPDQDPQLEDAFENHCKS